MARTEDLRVWRMFCEIVRAGGIHAASDRLDCEPSTASRAVKAIEAEIGTPLFLRDKRPLELTETGQRAYEKAEALLAAYQEMVDDLRGDKNRLSGMIRLAAHAGIGPTDITPGLVLFQDTYPDIEIELRLLRNSLPAVFFDGGPKLDVVVGYGPDTPMPGIVARYVGEMPFIPCASPRYLQRHGTPRHPSELVNHTGVLLQTPSRNSTETLSKGDRTVNLLWKKTLRFNSLISAKNAAVLSAGIVPDMPLFHAHDAFQSKQLVPILSGWRRKSASCFVCATEAAWEKRRVRVFVEWLAERERSSLTKLREENPEFYE